VAAKFVRKAQRPVHYAIVGQDDGVIERTAANQAHRAERLDVTLETKSARAGQHVAKRVRKDDHFDLLLADKRMRKIDIALHAKFVGGIDADAAIVFDQFNWTDDLKLAATATEAAYASLIQEPQEWFGRAIEDWNLDAIDIDEDVVDPGGVNGGEEVFGGGKKHALFHQTGGVADAGDVAATGLNRKKVQIRAAKNDATVGGGG